MKKEVRHLLAHWGQYGTLSREEVSWLNLHAQVGQASRNSLLYSPSGPQSQKGLLFFVSSGLLATGWCSELGHRRIDLFLTPTHAAFSYPHLYSQKAMSQGIYALRKSSYVVLTLAALRDYKEHCYAGSVLAHVLMTRINKQYYYKSRLLLLANPIGRYKAFYQEPYMKPFLRLTTQREQADYLNISKMSVTRAISQL